VREYKGGRLRREWHFGVFGVFEELLVTNVMGLRIVLGLQGYERVALV